MEEINMKKSIKRLLGVTVAATALLLGAATLIFLGIDPDRFEVNTTNIDQRAIIFLVPVI